MLQDKDQLEISRTLSWTKGEGSLPETVLYGEDNPKEDHRFGYLLNFDKEHHPENQARVVANVTAIAFNDVCSALEEDGYREISVDTDVITSEMYGKEPNISELTEDIVNEIEEWGVE